MVTLHKTWLLYLRKSRQDDPNETVEQVLAKHEATLQEWAERELGHRIEENDIYREIVSGESIDEREEIKKVLARLEDPAVAGVVCMNPSRLSRGDLSDCAKIIDSFRFSNSQVATPYMVYDLTKKMERKFFQDELLRGNDFLEFTKEVLWAGRVAACKRGCYIARYAPYGYRKTTRGKDHTLEIFDDEADVVRMIFDWYTKEQLTPGRIAQRLNKMGVPAPRGEKWVKDTIRHIVRNHHYNGKIVFNKIKNTQVMEGGEIVTKRLTQADDDIIISEGLHPAIIDAETFQRAQELVARHPRVKHTYDLKNPLSGVLVCSQCGGSMIIHPYKHADDRYECKKRPRCFKSIKADELQSAVVAALETAELPALQLKVKNGDGQARKIQERLLAKLEKQMEEYRAQEERQLDLLETNPNYSQEIFNRRHAALREKMEQCQADIYKAKSVLPQSVDYAERAMALQAAIDALKNPEATPAEKNKMVRAIVDRIEYTGSQSIDHTKRKGQPRGVNDFTLSISLRL